MPCLFCYACLIIFISNKTKIKTFLYTIEKNYIHNEKSLNALVVIKLLKIIIYEITLNFTYVQKLAFMIAILHITHKYKSHLHHFTQILSIIYAVI